MIQKMISRVEAGDQWGRGEKAEELGNKVDQIILGTYHEYPTIHSNFK